MFGHAYFGQAYFGNAYWGQSTGVPPPVFEDLHDGGPKERKKWKKKQEKRREDILEAFERVTEPEEVPVIQPVPVVRNEPRVVFRPPIAKSVAPVTYDLALMRESARIQMEAVRLQAEMDEEDALLLL